MSMRRNQLGIMGLLVSGGLLAGTSHAGDLRGGFRLPFEANVTVTGSVILPNDPAYAPYAKQCGGQAPVQVTQGAGDSPDLNLFSDVQSHCLLNPVPDNLDPTK